MKSLFFAIIIGIFAGTGLCFFEGITATWSAILIGIPIILLSYIIEKYSLLKNKRLSVFSAILAFFFSTFCTIGKAMSIDGSLRFLFSSKTHIISGLLGFICYFIFLFSFICCLFGILINQISIQAKTNCTKCPFGAAISKKPFLFSFFILLLVYFLYLLISYPALFMGDDSIMLSAVSGNLSDMTTHHPIGYSLFLSSIFRLFHFLTGSWNATAFIYSIIQIILFSLVLSTGIKYIKDCNINWKLVGIILLYYCFTPCIQNYTAIITKDVFYSAALLLISESLLSILRNGISSKNSITMIIGALCVLFCRNEGIFLIVILFAVILFSYKKLRKYSLSFLIAILCVNFLYSFVFVNIAKINEGSKREILSIPLLQTARCVKENSDSITEEEREIIINAFCDETWGISDINELAVRYDPMISDDVKAGYAYDILSENSLNYLKTWIKMGLKYPISYLDAFVANNYEYFYPESQLQIQPIRLSNWSLQHVNNEKNMDISHPEYVERIHSIYESATVKLYSYPPFCILNSSAAIIWIFFLWFFWLIYAKKYSRLIFTVIPIFILAICLVSPCNGSYCRYQYPLLIYLPWTILASTIIDVK